MSEKVLEILIPTYNRGVYLNKNIISLKEMIEKNLLVEKVNIIISNNASNDDTESYLDKYDENYIISFTQKVNIGLENNALFVLSKASADYVMLLGDDDYINVDYLKTVLSMINSRNNISMIIPNFELYDEGGKSLKVLREPIQNTSYFNKNSYSAYLQSLYCHQLSGLVYKRSDIAKASSHPKFSTLYPFIYWGCVSAQNGDVAHITQFPVKVTQVAQSKKDWDYGEDGLLIDKMICFKPFDKKLMLRFLLECKTLHLQSFGMLSYLRKSVFSYVKLYWKLFESNHVSTLCKIYLPFFFFVAPIINLHRILNLLKKKIFY